MQRPIQVQVSINTGGESYSDGFDALLVTHAEEWVPIKRIVEECIIGVGRFPSRAYDCLWQIRTMQHISIITSITTLITISCCAEAMARDESIPRGIKVVTEPLDERGTREVAEMSSSVAAAVPVTFFLNRHGGTFTRGTNDARSNTSKLVPGDSVQFPAAMLTQSDWRDVVACVQDQFSRFNVEVTSIDPGNVPHYEAVVSGSPQLLGQSTGVSGISPFEPSCAIIPNSIVFIFTEVLPPDPQVICEIVAQELAHSFGLDHEYYCADPMSYLQDCGAKTFQDKEVPCGEYEARTCAQPGPNGYDCNRATQNSVALLTERLGGDGSMTGPVATPQVYGTCSTGAEPLGQGGLYLFLVALGLLWRRRTQKA